MMLGRIPIRLRVTLGFTAAMALLIAALGAFVWFELRAQLDESIDDTLRSRLSEVSALALGRFGGGGVTFSFGEEDETFAQVIRRDGSLAYTSAASGERPLLSAEQVRDASRDPLAIDRVGAPGGDGDARLLGSRLPRAGGATVVVGASLDDRDETLSSLATLLLIGGPVALLLASLAGYAAASAALRPVEAMRRRAGEIETAGPTERLPVPPARDELRRLAETLNGMLARLDVAFERERRFVDEASHELRTPLALQKTELETALRHASGEGELRAAITSAIEEVDRLIALAEALLITARSGEEGLAITCEDLAVTGLLATIRSRFQARAERAGRLLAADDSARLAVRGDRLRLEQALTALVDNALRHGAGEVRLSAEARDGVVELHVCDEGPGFSPEFLPRAFERFSRADPGRARGGVGLGLAIVAAIAEAHDGRTGAANGPDGGADVWIGVPGSSA